MIHNFNLVSYYIMEKTYIILLLAILISTFFLTKTFKVHYSLDILFILLIVYLYNKHKLASFGILIIYLSVRNTKLVRENFVEGFPKCIISCLKDDGTIGDCNEACKNKCKRNCSREFPNKFSSCGDICSNDTSVDSKFKDITIQSKDVSNKCMIECLNAGEEINSCMDYCLKPCMKKCTDKEAVVCTKESNNSCIESPAGSYKKCNSICP